MFLIEPGFRESGESAIFSRLPDGHVASIFIAAGTWVRLEPVAGAATAAPAVQRALMAGAAAQLRVRNDRGDDRPGEPGGVRGAVFSRAPE